MSIYNPVIGIIKNTTKNTHHPIVFTYYPMPGKVESTRMKSKMHHTNGFDTWEKAIENINTVLLKQLKAHFIGEPKIDLDAEMSWDGEDIPAVVAFLVDNKLTFL